jgi:hypothetical protein
MRIILYNMFKAFLVSVPLTSTFAKKGYILLSIHPITINQKILDTSRSACRAERQLIVPKELHALNNRVYHCCDEMQMNTKETVNKQCHSREYIRPISRVTEAQANRCDLKLSI